MEEDSEAVPQRSWLDSSFFLTAKKKHHFSHRKEWFALGLLYLVSFAFRLMFWKIAPYGDEGMLYYISRHGPTVVKNLGAIYDLPIDITTTPFFLQRPLFYVLMAPGAQISFEAYRLQFILLSSLLAILLVLLLRELRVHAGLAYGAGAVVAVHPKFVVWGTIGLMDSLMTLALAIALWMALTNRPAASGAFALAAVWIKEVAIVGVAFLFLVALYDGWRRNETSLWPFRLTRLQSAYLLALSLSFVPLKFASWSDVPLPGGPGSTPTLNLLDPLFLTVWFAPFLVWGLRWTRTRFVCLLGLLFPAFFLLIHAGAGRAVEIWYMIPSSFFTLMGVGLVLDEGWARTRGKTHLLKRAIPQIATVAILLLMVVYVLVPNGPIKARALRPISAEGTTSFLEDWEFERNRGKSYEDALQKLDLNPERLVFVMDIYMPHVLYPIAENVKKFYVADSQFTEAWSLRIEPFAHAVETLAPTTILQKKSNPLNQAIREVYKDCFALENEEYVVLHGNPCSGRTQILMEEFDRRRAPS